MVEPVRGLTRNDEINTCGREGGKILSRADAVRYMLLSWFRLDAHVHHLGGRVESRHGVEGWRERYGHESRPAA
jgi:hypothetical protein